MKVLTFPKFVLISFAALCALAIVYILTSFEHVTGPTTFVLFALGVCGTLSVFTASFLGKEKQTLGAIVVCSVVATLYFADFYFSSFGKDELTLLRMQSASEEGIEFDQRTIEQVIVQLRDIGRSKAVPSIGPHALLGERYFNGIPLGERELLPLGGISDRTTVLCNEIGEWITYESDERGFNNPPGMWDVPLDVAVIGDSFAHGACVREEDHWVSQIRARYPGTLNLGVGGNDLLSEFASFKEYLPLLRPNVILWAYYEGNDLRISEELQSPVLLRYLHEDSFRQDLSSYQDEIDDALDTIVDLRLSNPEGFDFVALIKLYNLRRQFGVVDIVPTESLVQHVDPERLKVLKSVLSAANRMTRNWGGELYFVYLPQSARFTPVSARYRPREDLSPYYADVIQVVNGLGIPLIDLVPEFDSGDNPMSYFPFELHGHYSREGYDLLAREVLGALEAEASSPVQ